MCFREPGTGGTSAAAMSCSDFSYFDFSCRMGERALAGVV